ncbi:DsbA family protein [Flavobacterium sp. F52]|uniref:DsbA family protein n=1 Tax=Flavobacterium sp. F52 TaxID=1202532 RepID=UPI000272D86A|nr:DsbA family protein [Flavobacterium sp. F52]EJG03177.1 DSBA oxidoreductase [Flavobacterium sp. F52]
MSLTVPVNEKDHVQGNSSAVVELLEYGDYQCPHCQRAYPIVKEIQRDYGRQLKFVFRNFPLAHIHPQAKMAALASEAAARQHKYWEMHDYLFEHHEDFSFESVVQIARIMNLDVEQFKEDIFEMDIDTSSKVEQDLYSGIRSGVNGTPTFFVNGEQFFGNWENDQLRDFLYQKMNE